jgi:hypothetical protein
MAFAPSLVPRSARWLIPLLALAGCRNDPAPSSIDLVLPDGTGRRTPFEVRSSFAEYVELGELRRELRITLASYALSCERYVAPGPDDVLLTVTVTAPASDPLRPGSIPASSAEASESDGGKVSRPSALPVARRGPRSYVFPGGGSLELGELDLSPAGRVRGVLAFEFAGDGARPAASARGKFEARICRAQ